MSASIVPTTNGRSLPEIAKGSSRIRSKRWNPAQISRQRRLYMAILVALGHALVITAAILFARIHSVLLASPQMRNDLAQLGARLLDFFPVVQGVCYTVAVVHALPLAHTLRSIFRFLVRVPRKVFSVRSRRMSSVSSSKRPSGPEYASVAIATPPWYVRAWERIDDFFSAYPIEIGQVRLLVEIMLQTFQANKMSQLVATVWLNRLLACVIVVNCWFTPLVFVTMRGHTLYMTRVVRLLIDTALDAVYSFGIPVVILYPYWRDYIPVLRCFPYDFYALDTWTIIAAAETRQVFVTSWLDLISKMLPWFFFCYRLQALRSLVAARQTRSRAAMTRSRSRLSRVLNAVLVAWGIVILLLHLRVSWIGDSLSMRGCLVEMRPWFSTSYTCTVVELSCSQRHISGQHDEIARVFSETDAQKIEGLIISHCPEFVMPAEIQSLIAVAMFKFYNTTIVDWPVASALTNTTNPAVQQFFAVRVNFTSFPAGLLEVDLPETMRDVKFIATNLATLPPQFAHAWHTTRYLAMELNPLLREVPEAVARLPQLLFLTMDSNTITDIPDMLLQNLTAIQMRFINNPIARIPEFVGRPGVTLSVVFAYTNVSALPESWLKNKDDMTKGVLSIEAEHTPLCEDLQRQHLSVSGSATTPIEFWIGRFRVACVDVGGYYTNVSYPIETEDSLRQTNRLVASGS